MDSMKRDADGSIDFYPVVLYTLVDVFYEVGIVGIEFIEGGEGGEGGERLLQRHYLLFVSGFWIRVLFRSTA